MSELLISEQNGLRTLHFGSEWVQGRMRISRPAELMLGYAQDMCAALLFVPPPKRVYVAGLGVGSLPRWALANWTESLRHMEIAELRADVLALAGSAFPLPMDDARLQLTQGDAAKIITERPAASVDWMWVDCYDGRGRVGALESAEFYSAAHAALKTRGVFVANMWSSVTRYRGGLRRLRAVFGDNNIVLLPAIATENVTVIATKSPLPALDSRAMQARARALHAEYKLPFERWLKALAPVSAAL
jgi:spermidine synthase